MKHVTDSDMVGWVQASLANLIQTT